MRLCIVTQAVDREDPILGFFHRWIEEFARHCDHVIVIGQRVGEYAFPDNVEVFSLGKEERFSRLVQILRFFRLQWKLRKRYDVAFIHMTPIWAVIGMPIWFLLRTPLYLWYEARGGGVALRIAARTARKIFSASARGLPFPSSRNVVTGHGIDTTFFSPSGERESGLIVSVGRITAAKHPEQLLGVFRELPTSCRLVLAGAAITPTDRELLSRLRKNADDRITIRPFHQQETRDLLRRAQLFLHMSDTGLDKAVLEAMACGCVVLSTGKVFQDMLPSQCQASPGQMAENAQKLLQLPSKEYEALSRELRTLVEEGHGLGRLIRKLIQEMERKQG